MSESTETSDKAAKITDRAGRQLSVNGEHPAPLHPFDGDENGHNCARCPSDGLWRCDVLAHPKHFTLCFTQRDPVPLDDDGEPLPCDCRIWRLFPDTARVEQLARQVLNGG